MIKDFDTMEQQISTQISDFISTEILRQPSREIALDEALISSGVIDSFSLMDLALFIEDNFGVRIEDTELSADTFDTLQQLVELIKERKQ